MPMLESSVAITTSQQPEQRGVAGEAVAGGDAHQRDQAAEGGEQRERPAVQARDDRHVHVAGAPAAALGEQHHRQPSPLGELEQAVLLGVVAHPLRAGQDGVVVGHHHAGVAVDVSRRRPPARRRACARSAPRACADAPGRRTAAARTRRTCPSSTSSARFSRAVRRPCSWRRATASRTGGVEADLVALAHRLQVAPARPQARAPRRARPRAPATALGSSVASSWPSLTASPTATASSRTIPSTSASTSCSIFIASSTTTGAPRPHLRVGLQWQRRRRPRRTAPAPGARSGVLTAGSSPTATPRARAGRG